MLGLGPIIIVCIVAFIVWVVWKVRAHDRALDKAKETAALEQAWRAVLDDPHYEHRRQYEERKREEEAREIESRAPTPS